MDADGNTLEVGEANPPRDLSEAARQPTGYSVQGKSPSPARLSTATGLDTLVRI